MTFKEWLQSEGIETIKGEFIINRMDQGKTQEFAQDEWQDLEDQYQEVADDQGWEVEFDA